MNESYRSLFLVPLKNFLVTGQRGMYNERKGFGKQGDSQMGVYLNPTNDKFAIALNSPIYVDKTELIAYTNRVVATEQRYVCVSRPRRFGKSMAANMLTAYYSRGCDSREMFHGLKIFMNPSFEQYLNQYDVIMLNMQEFLSRTQNIEEMLERLKKMVVRDLKKAYPDVDYFDVEDVIQSMQDVYTETGRPFIIIIDEWDCVLRECTSEIESQKIYLDFLRDFLKDKGYIHLVYMTGILPIKKYGTHSALNMFEEFSMTNPGPLAEYVGFTSDEVEQLCVQYDMDYDEMKRWYDGYRLGDNLDIYSPRSVVSAILNRRFDNYWNQTETFEALKIYIEMNYDGLKDTVIEMMAGARKQVDVRNFTNDMTTFHSYEDVLTLLIHLGYLGYEFETKEAFIPNSEVADEYITAVKAAGWEEVIRAVQSSAALLRKTWDQNEDAVAEGIEKAHLETSHLQYNDENALSYTIDLAYYSARQYYTIVREMPTGKGFADLVFLPRKKYSDKPAMIVELKWDKSIGGAIEQIKKNEYVSALKDYQGNVLLVGVNYNKKSRQHECKIELWK